MSGEFAELGSLADFVNGAAFTPDDWSEDGKRIIRIQNLTDAGKPFNRTTREVPARLHVQPGDLLVSWSASLGVFEWAGPDVALLNQHIFRVLPNERKVDKRYLRHGLERALREMQRHLHGATMQHVNRGEFLSTRLFTPPLAEQRRIAEILDKADALRAKRRTALAQLDNLAQSIFVTMFGDPSTNPQGYPTIVLAAIVREDDAINYGVVQPGDEVDDGVPLIRVSDLAGGTINHSAVKHISPTIEVAYRRSRLRGDEILVSCVGTIGIVALADETVRGFNIARAVARIPLNDAVDRIFVASYLRTTAVQRYFTSELRTVSQPTLNIKQLSETQVFLPPLQLQREYARRIKAAEAVSASEQTALMQCDALFASLQHRAFLGRL